MHVQSVQNVANMFQSMHDCKIMRGKCKGSYNKACAHASGVRESKGERETDRDRAMEEEIKIRLPRRHAAR